MIELKNIHLGQAIKKRFDELEITKTEFGRRIGIPQQHVNRIFERDTMETKRLIKICRALDYNFFALFCEFPSKIDAYLSAVNIGDGDMTYQMGGEAVVAELNKVKAEAEGYKREIALLKENIGTLKSTIETKDELIAVYKNK